MHGSGNGRTRYSRRSGPLNLINRNILDVGCATGWFTEELSRFGQAMGVDLSEHAIGIARQCYPNVPFEAGDFLKMPLPASLSAW